jgi:arsenate reductase
MAEGFARHSGQGRVEANSAGMAPSTLNPHAVRVMQEKGLDITGQQSKAFDWEGPGSADRSGGDGLWEC